MLSRAEQQLGERIDRVLALVQEKLDRRPGAEATAAFVRQYFERVEPDDVLGRSVENLYGAAVSLWRFAEKRTPGTARIRAYNPRVEQDGWASPHTVIEIVNDDMPFLVDSVTMALAGRDRGQLQGEFSSDCSISDHQHPSGRKLTRGLVVLR